MDAVVAALAPAMQDRVPAAHHGLLGGAVVFFGRHPDTGRNFVVQSIEGGGWGGRPGEDGESGTVSVCQGDVRNATIEGIELKCPVLVEQRALRTDSGGAGEYRGGLGIDVNVVNMVDGRWNFQGSLRRTAPPWGLWGGGTGATHGFLLQEPGDSGFREMDAQGYAVPPHAEVVVRTGGGGGWGDPLNRDPGKVSSDVSEGYVSPEAAERDYGVVLDAGTLAVDSDATAELRRARRG